MDASLDLLKEIVGDGKSIEGDSGWLFLCNDTNNQLAQQFGLLRWTAEETHRANKVLEERLSILNFYKKFIVPEKSVAYREYLPDLMKSWEDDPDRPARILKDASYLLPCIDTAKAHGQLYFRGDTHPNWIGSYFLYKHIISAVGLDPLPMQLFTPSLAGFDGDLFGWLSDHDKQEFQNRVDCSKYTVDASIQLTLETASARLVEQGYTEFSRPTLVYENSNKSLPTAVVFRDSTSQFMTAWIAEHFSRSTFVWHQGNVISNVIESEKPDFIIQIMAERFVWNYPNRTALTTV